jgi:lipoprotein NlpD
MEGIIRNTEKIYDNPGVLRLCQSWFFLLCFLFFFLLMSCAVTQEQKNPAKGVYHIVKKGETAYGIARAYSISLQDLAEVNNIDNIDFIKEGLILFIPDADQIIDDVIISAARADTETKKDEVLKKQKSADAKKLIPPDELAGIAKNKHPDKLVASGLSPVSGVPPIQSLPEKKAPVTREKPDPAANKDEIKREKGQFVWPVKGVVKTGFGIQPNKTFHNWIKITCPAGTRVKAAADGTVIFSALLKDFGETIIIRHANDYATVYTHLLKRNALVEQSVTRGKTIALAGEIDDKGDNFINFEIRLKGKARNPLFYLPSE